eukprot:TRINITY_DN12295_c0_g1_i1.p1 TRINITY_DN12295_c0_g1~~TRINITY_DN12295_c0_g1_i1.p1  ORF type:complete len:215 (+),score=29.73 TRINITY_DN12295_c0_g1_i1:86-646(+)
MSSHGTGASKPSVKVVTYRNDGTGRDAYVNMRIPQPSAISNISNRRDTLPDNVFKYLREQVRREQYDQYTKDLARVGARNGLCRGGRRIICRDRVDMQEEARLAAIEEKFLRQQRLKALGRSTRSSWTAWGFRLKRSASEIRAWALERAPVARRPEGRGNCDNSICGHQGSTCDRIGRSSTPAYPL